MLSIFFAALFIIATLPNPTESADGINCEGSSGCSHVITEGYYVAQQLTNNISHIDQNRWYANQEQIACVRIEVRYSGVDLGVRSTEEVWYCAFLQNTGGAWGSKIVDLAHYIPDHGCDACGSVPYSYPSSNDGTGQLTYNYVRHHCSTRDGLCSSSSAVRAFSMCTTFTSLSMVCIFSMLYLWV